jgi:hypothetical protein
MQQAFAAELFSDRPNKSAMDPFRAAVNSLTNNVMLQGFAKLFGGMLQSNSSKGILDQVTDSVTGGATTMIPFGSAVNQLSKTAENVFGKGVKRDAGSDNILTKNLINRTAQRTPFRFFLPPQISNTGDPIKEDNIISTFISPGKIKEIKTDNVTKELMRLYNESNLTKQFPAKATGSINYKSSKTSESTKYMLTPEDLLNMQKLMGAKNKAILEETINSSTYQNLNDNEKADRLSDLMSNEKQKAETEFLKTKDINEYKGTGKKSMFNSKSKKSIFNK